MALAGVTHLNIVNNLLVRLRESTVSAITDTPYATLLGAIVAEAYEEVLDEWNWSWLDQEAFIVFPTDSTWEVIANGVAGFGAVFNPECEFHVAREHGQAKVQIFDVSPSDLNFDQEQGRQLCEMTYQDLVAERRRVGAKDADWPTHFAIVKDQTNNDWQIHLLQKTTREMYIQMQYTLDPEPWKVDGSTDSVECTIPPRPVQELAMMYALNERGEEQGEPGNLAERRYLRALAAAKEADVKAGEHANNYDWIRG